MHQSITWYHSTIFYILFWEAVVHLLVSPKQRLLHFSYCVESLHMEPTKTGLGACRRAVLLEA